jgi:hypothetical protein
MAIFPSTAANGDKIRPSARSFSIGEFPVKAYRSLSGAIVKRSFGNRASNYTLEVEFAAVSEQVLLAIFNHYQGQGGITSSFDLPDTLFSGYTGEFSSLMQSPSFGSNRWFYAEAPQVTSKPNGLSDISVKFVSEIPASMSIG